MASIRLSICDMECGGCAAGVKKAIASVDPAAKPLIDLKSKNVDFDSDASAEQFVKALEQAGFEAKSIAPSGR